MFPDDLGNVMAELIIVALLAIVAGLVIGWLVASRRAGALASDLAVARTRVADADLVRQARDAVERERNEAMQHLATLRAEAASQVNVHRDAVDQLARARDLIERTEADRQQTHRELAGLRSKLDADEKAHQATLKELRDAREAMQAGFDAAAAKALETAQTQFLERAHQRFTESEALQGQKLSALLQPVNDRLQRYEEGVASVERERRDAFGDLKGQIEQMRLGQEKVSSEAAKLVNSLRNAPKSRGRWGEQQLKNVLETCGLAEHTDFDLEVSVSDGVGGRIRPDAIVRVPGGKALVIDAKVSLNAYQDAFGAVDETERLVGLRAHADSMRAHVNGLGNKSYWNQFADAPDYVIMFVPGEHFLSAALEHDPTLWDFAFDKRVLLATPTNLIAIARTVAAVWRQEKLAGEARAIAELGKELYARLCVMGGHVSKLGKNLDTAIVAYNAFVGSMDSSVLTSAKRFEALNIDTGAKLIETPPIIEQSARSSVKLPMLDAAE